MNERRCEVCGSLIDRGGFCHCEATVDRLPSPGACVCGWDIEDADKLCVEADCPWKRTEKGEGEGT